MACRINCKPFFMTFILSHFLLCNFVAPPMFLLTKLGESPFQERT